MKKEEEDVRKLRMLCAYKTCEIYVSVLVRFRTEKRIRFTYVKNV